MRRCVGQFVAFLDETDLAEELVDGSIGDVHPGKRADALGLFAKMLDRGAAAIAGEEVRLELARLRNLEFRIEIAAQCEEAAPHSAISR